MATLGYLDGECPDQTALMCMQIWISLFAYDIEAFFPRALSIIERISHALYIHPFKIVLVFTTIYLTFWLACVNIRLSLLVCKHSSS